jgi:hypothetical protein
MVVLFEFEIWEYSKVSESGLSGTLYLNLAVNYGVFVSKKEIVFGWIVDLLI